MRTNGGHSLGKSYMRLARLGIDFTSSISVRAPSLQLPHHDFTIQLPAQKSGECFDTAARFPRSCPIFPAHVKAFFKHFEMSISNRQCAFVNPRWS